MLFNIQNIGDKILNLRETSAPHHNYYFWSDCLNIFFHSDCSGLVDCSMFNWAFFKLITEPDQLIDQFNWAFFKLIIEPDQRLVSEKSLLML